MTERSTLATIDRIDDTDTEMYRVGESEGGFDEEALKRHLESGGEHAYGDLCERLVYMGAQLRKAWMECPARFGANYIAPTAAAREL